MTRSASATSGCPSALLARRSTPAPVWWRETGQPGSHHDPQTATRSNCATTSFAGRLFFDEKASPNICTRLGRLFRDCTTTTRAGLSRGRSSKFDRRPSRTNDKWGARSAVTRTILRQPPHPSTCSTQGPRRSSSTRTESLPSAGRPRSAPPPPLALPMSPLAIEAAVKGVFQRVPRVGFSHPFFRATAWASQQWHSPSLSCLPASAVPLENSLHPPAGRRADKGKNSWEAKNPLS